METIKVLAQSVPVLNVLTDLYTVPALTRTVVSTIYCCNQNATSVHFRISIAIAGAVDTPAQYIYYDILLLANSSFAATVGLTLGPSDVIRVRSDASNVSFNAFGAEIT